MIKLLGFIKLKKGVGIFLILLLITMPALAQAAQDQEQPAQAETDAEKNEPEKPLTDAELGKRDGALVTDDKQDLFNLLPGYCAVGTGLSLPAAGWVIENQGRSCDEIEIGCIGITIAYLVGAVIGLLSFIPPNPPAYAFVGKSPEYVKAYTEAFRKKAQKTQSKAYYSTYSVIGFFWVIILLGDCITFGTFPH